MPISAIVHSHPSSSEMGCHGRESQCMRRERSVKSPCASTRYSLQEIQSFLERRARIVRDTSDSLAQLAREKLLDARYTEITSRRAATTSAHVCLFRLANFPITDAVDTLTLGSVNFLPERISVNNTIDTHRWNLITPLLGRKQQHLSYPLQKRNVKRFYHVCTKFSPHVWRLPNYPLNLPMSPSVRECRGTTAEVFYDKAMSVF